MQLLKNRICSGRPAERLTVGIVVSDELVDTLHQLLDTGERSTPDGLVGDQREEPFDLVQPGTVGRDEVHVPAWPTGQPGLDLRMTMSGVVVHDAVDVQLGRNRLVDLAQEGQELLVAVARLAAGQHGAVQDIQRCKQRRGAMALVVVGNALDAVSYTHLTLPTIYPV